MLIIKIATLPPSHTFITIILSYSVVMFWSSLSLLFSVSTPGSTSFVQSSNCPLIGHCWLSLIKFRDMLNNIEKETKCLNLKRKIKVSQNAKFSQNREINVPRKFHVIRYNLILELPDKLCNANTAYKQFYQLQKCISISIRLSGGQLP